jgi:hypothetical protein
LNLPIPFEYAKHYHAFSNNNSNPKKKIRAKEASLSFELKESLFLCSMPNMLYKV